MAIKSLNNKMLNVAYLEGAESIVISGDGGGEDTPIVEESDYELPPKRVNFYDYDGTLLHTYPWEEALQMTELPPLPSHEGLICQEWNYTLEDIKEQEGYVDVGATYTTSDGATRLHISLNEATLNVNIKIATASNAEVLVNWGDGSETESLPMTSAWFRISHDYLNVGDYVISIHPITGSFTISEFTDSNNNSGGAVKRKFKNILREVNLGDNVKLENYAFREHSHEIKVSIPNNIQKLPNNVFDSSYVACIIAPKGVTNVGFNSCYTLKLSIPNTAKTFFGFTGGLFREICLPKNCRISDGFSSCINLEYVIFPKQSDKIYSHNLFSSCTNLKYADLSNCIISSNSIFFNCKQLRKVILNPNQDIAYQMFYGCISLKSFKIPDGCTTINQGAFYGCYSLSLIDIPESVTTINDSAFRSCYALTSVKLSKNLLVLGKSAFVNCKTLASVTIPDNVQEIGDATFSGCESLEKVKLPANIKSIGASAFSGCAIKDIQFPEGLQSIGGSAFSQCYSLRSIKLPSSVTTLGAAVFQNCYNLVSVILPESLTTLPDSTFYNDYALRNITIPNGLSVGAQAFADCYNIEDMQHILDNISSANSTAFKNLDLSEYTLPNIPNFCFGYNNLSDVTIPSNAESIYLAGNLFKSITIPENVKYINERGFYDCKYLTEIIMPDSIESIGASAFGACQSLTKVKLSNNITNIPQTCFNQCLALSVIEIPKSVQSIESGAFGNCHSMTIYDFTSHETIPSLASSSALGHDTNYEIRVPMALVDEWKDATNWSAHADYIVGVE